MPKLKDNQFPSYRLHRQSGQAVVTLNGKDHLLGTHGTQASKATYDQLIAEWVAAGRRPKMDANSLTIAELICAYRKHCRAYYRDAEGNVSRNITNIDDALKPVFKLYGKTPAAEFGPLKLKAVREQMIAAGRVRTNINRHMIRIRGMFKWAVENEMLPAEVFHGLMAVSGLRAGRCGAKEGEPVKPVPLPHVEAVLPRLSDQVAAMVRLQLLTGMRPGEVVIMRTCDIDRCGPLWVYQLQKHKTQLLGHERNIYLGPKAQDVLTPFLRPDLAGYIFKPTDAEAARRQELSEARTTPPSCGNRPGSNRRRRPKRCPGDRYDVATYYRAIARACDEAFPPPPELARQRVPAVGRKHNSTRWETMAEHKARLGAEKWEELSNWRKQNRWHPHQLRHTAATELRRQHGLEAAQVILGHRTLTVTQVYAEKNVEAAKRVMALVG